MDRSLQWQARENHGLVQVEVSGVFNVHRHSSPCDSGNRVLFPAVVHFDSGGGSWVVD